MAKRGRKTNIWQVLPREKKLVRPHIRITKKGMQYVESHMREYPVNPFKDNKDAIRPKSAVEKEKRSLMEKIKEDKERIAEKLACLLR